MYQMYLFDSHVESANYGVIELIKLSYISMSLDFVNKPLSLISPPQECCKLNKPLQGLNRAVMVPTPERTSFSDSCSDRQNCVMKFQSSD